MHICLFNNHILCARCCSRHFTNVDPGPHYGCYNSKNLRQKNPPRSLQQAFAYNSRSRLYLLVCLLTEHSITPKQNQCYSVINKKLRENGYWVSNDSVCYEQPFLNFSVNNSYHSIFFFSQEHSSFYLS